MNIQEIIGEDLRTERDSRSKRVRSGLYSPSSLGKCFRAQYWNRKNEPITNPPDERTLRIFSVGDIFHKWIQERIRKVNPDIQCEVPVKTDSFYGFADIVNGDEVIDIKTMHSKGFWYLDKCEDIKKEKYTNWLQVMFYAINLGKKYAKLCFVSKDDLCINEYREEVNDYWINEINKEIQTLELIWHVQKTPPAQPRAYGGKECGYCQFKDACGKLEKETK